MAFLMRSALLVFAERSGRATLSRTESHGMRERE